jgi:hypothetical protein
MQCYKCRATFFFQLLFLFLIISEASTVERSTHDLQIIKRCLDEKGCDRLQHSFPEGAFFGLVLYGLSWAQSAILDTNDLITGNAISEATWALEKLETDYTVKSPFDETLSPQYGIFYAGWINLLQGRIVQISKNQANYLHIKEEYEKRCGEIASAYQKSDCVFLQSYKGAAWPADNAVAIASLALHDIVCEKKYSEIISTWVSKLKFLFDDVTGLVPHSVNSLDCSIIEGARGSTQVLMNRFWPLISRDFAKDQFCKFKRLFDTRILFFRMVREYPKGIKGYGDIDSGPVIWGAGATATIVGLAAYRANGDEKSWQSLLNSVNFLKYPVGLLGTRRYNDPNILIGELFIIWSNLTLNAD